jgi:hypothetical protein
MATQAQYDAATAAATAVFTKFIQSNVPSFEQGVAEKFLGSCVPGAAKAAVDASDAVAKAAGSHA